MKEKIKVIIKRPDEKVGHVTWISNTLENLQRTVGGHIEVYNTGIRDVTIICDEEGKLKHYVNNFHAGIMFPELFVGTVIVCGTNSDEFTDVPISLKEWKLMLEMWGNAV